MKDDNEAKYITFPIEFLMGLENMDFGQLASRLHLAMDYAFYLVYRNLECIEESAQTLGISFGNPEKSLEHGCELYERFGNCPLVSVNKNMIFEFYKNEKTDSEKLIFATYCGLRSILGNRKLAKTNNQLLIARLLGFNKFKDFQESNHKSAWFDSYFSTKNKVRYHLTEKILMNEICLNWGMKYYGDKTRGFYFSFKVSQPDLVYYAEKNKKSYKVNLMKDERKKAKLEALKRLNQTPQ